MATHSSVLAWEIPRTEEPGGLQSLWLQRVAHAELLSLTLTHIFKAGNSYMFFPIKKSLCLIVVV